MRRARRTVIMIFTINKQYIYVTRSRGFKTELNRLCLSNCLEKWVKGEVDNMGKGRGGGRSPTPNDDRSRSMNPQDVVGQAAIVNTARQRGDDDDWGDDDYGDGGSSEAVFTTIEPEEPEPEGTVERLIPPTGETASIKWSRVDNSYILTLSDRDLVALVGVPYGKRGIQQGDISIVKEVLELLGYEVEIKWELI